MASILDIVLQGEISPDTVIVWLQKLLNDVPETLTALTHFQQEFIPYFLNYLRDHTLHQLQNSKSANPSPAKTPSIKKLRQPLRKDKGESSKRQQLFGSSPAGDVDDIKHLPSSVFTPNTSLDFPVCVSNSKYERQNQRGGAKSNYASQKFSPRCGSQNMSFGQQTPDHQRSKQKFSLAEFFTPEQGGHVYKKRSPHSGPSGGRRDYFNQTSPSPGMSRRSGGRRKTNTSPLVQASSAKIIEDSQSPPVFCLTSASDFPPMDQDKQPFERVFSKSCDTRASREINFSCPDTEHAISEHPKVKLKGSCKKVSPATQDLIGAMKVKQNYSSTSGARHNPTTSIVPRRITPTFVKEDNSVPQDSAFLVPIEEKSDTKKIAVCDTPRLGVVQSTDLDKSVLVEEQLQEDRLGNDPFSSVITPTKLPLHHSTSITETVCASIEEVTYRDKLDLLISLYSKCLDANLLPNIVVEFYFLVQLLTARGDGENLEMGDLLEENYFKSIHNTVYFAVSVFELQKRLLCILDRGTLRLLSENQRIASFSPSLQQYLEDLHNKAESQNGPAFPRSPIGSVSFQADTDNRRNFPNDKSFHLFKRQRDGFYELIREWEACHMMPNWNMAEVQGNKIHTLVSYRTDLANHIHFARLFQSQLIAMCKGDGSLMTSDDDENIALLSQLKRSNPEKFKRLQERFIKPLSLGGPCPLPTFPGCQEFFREFIVLACNPVLNQHLCDTFSAKVLELNDTTFTLTDDDDGVQANEDDEEAELFCSVLMNSRLVAKFLGFVTFLPYQSPDKLPDSVESTYIVIRSKHLPQLDILDCLKLSVITGKLCLTVPWLVEYLSMIDSLAPSLDYYQQVLFLLLYVHRYVWQQLQDEISYTSLMIVALISWLLENPVFPEGFFFSDIPSEVTARLQDRLPTLAALDNRNFVDQALFYTCCPYIREVKTLLVEFAVGYGNKTSTIRKITPISADVPVKKPLSERQLQLQMEENFFHNHPASMKRVVDFAADRTASNFIKKFRAGLLHNSLTEGKEKVLKQLVAQSEGSPSSRMKDRISQVTSRVAQDLQARVRQSVASDTLGYCSTRIHSLMKLLLPDDQDSFVVTMAAEISVRIAEEKVIQWMNKHITVAMYQTELTPELDKVNKSINQSRSQTDLQSMEAVSSVTVTATQSSDSVVIATTHAEDLPHPSEVLIDLKDCVKAAAVGTKMPSEDKILELINSVKCSLERRQDILIGVYRSFGQLTVELLTLLMLNHTSVYTTEVIDICIALWKGPLVDYSLNHIVSGRIVSMIKTCLDCKASWQRYNSWLGRLLAEGLIKPSVLQDKLLKIIHSCQDEETLIHLSRCVFSLIEKVDFESKEQLGACLELLCQKLTGDVTAADMKGDFSLSELEETHSDHVKSERGVTMVSEIQGMLQELGMTNNNVIHFYGQKVSELSSNVMEENT